MTKYYYKGKLIRSRKTRDDYKFALIIVSNEDSNNFACLSCSSTYKGAMKNYSYESQHRYWVKLGLSHLEVVEINKGE